MPPRLVKKRMALTPAWLSTPCSASVSRWVRSRAPRTVSLAGALWTPRIGVGAGPDTGDVTRRRDVLDLAVERVAHPQPREVARRRSRVRATGRRRTVGGGGPAACRRRRPEAPRPAAAGPSASARLPVSVGSGDLLGQLRHVVDGRRPVEDGDAVAQRLAVGEHGVVGGGVVGAGRGDDGDLVDRRPARRARRGGCRRRAGRRCPGCTT